MAAQDDEYQYPGEDTTVASPFFLAGAQFGWFGDAQLGTSQVLDGRIFEAQASASACLGQTAARFRRPAAQQPINDSESWTAPLPSRRSSPRRLNPEAQKFQPGEPWMPVDTNIDPLLYLEDTGPQANGCLRPEDTSSLPYTPDRPAILRSGQVLRASASSGVSFNNARPISSALLSTPAASNAVWSTPGSSVAEMFSPSSLSIADQSHMSDSHANRQPQLFQSQPPSLQARTNSFQNLPVPYVNLLQLKYGDWPHEAVEQGRQNNLDVSNPTADMSRSHDINSWNQSSYTVGDHIDLSPRLRVPETPTPSQGRRASITNTTTSHACDHADCKRVCSSKSELESHQRCHGARNHICSMCNKAFLYSKDLRRHDKIHRADRHFYCTWAGCRYCTKGFQRKDHLDRHFKIHIRFMSGSQAMSRDGSQMQRQ